MSRKGKPVAFQFYAADWRGDPQVQRMTFAARGVYIELLACAFQDRGRLPGDPEEIRRVAGVDRDEWLEVWGQLERHWPVIDGERHNPKLTRVMEEQTGAPGKKVRGGQGGSGGPMAIA